MKEPKIRFNEFKGEWNSIDFQDSFMPLRNNSLSRAELCKAGEIANIHYGDILINYGECLDTSVDALTYICDSNVGKGLLRNGALKKGDIIFADAAEDNTVGKCVELICKDDEKIVSGLHTIACRPEIDVAEKYLGYYLNSHHYHNQLLPHIQGSKISSISKRAINTTFIVYPCDFQEQHSIASFFTTLDAQISASTSRLASLKQIKAASLQAMFPQEGETVPKLRFKGFEGEWEKVKLGEILTYEQPTKYLIANTEYKKNGTPVLTAGKTFILGYTSETSGIYTNLPVIIFDDFTTESKFVNFQFKAKSSAMKMLKPVSDLEIDINFAYEILKNIRFRVENHQRHWLSVFSKITVMLPSFAEQRAIASFFTNLDRQITLQSQRLEKLKQIKAACLDKMFV